MKRALTMLLASLLLMGCLTGCGNSNTPDKSNSNSTPSNSSIPTPTGNKELEGEITFWHSFTQGPRLETIQAAADAFMKDNPKVKINIETFSWADFYTKWTTGLASGNVPDMSSAVAIQVVEMIDADAIIPMDNLIDKIGRDKFYEKALTEIR